MEDERTEERRPGRMERRKMRRWQKTMTGLGQAGHQWRQSTTEAVQRGPKVGVATNFYTL